MSERVVSVPVAPILAKKSLTVRVDLTGYRFASVRLWLAARIFDLGGIIGGFRSVRVSWDDLD